MANKTYKKRAGTSGIQGQLYETKLISLVYFRMIHDDSVDQFSLATNRDDIGAFDDICFKAKIKGFNTPVTVFIQAKHRENDKLLTFTSTTELTKYFDSYLQIRRAFEPSTKDMIFGGKFDETECFFVMYTTAKDDPNNKIYEGSFADYLNALIGTGGSCTQPSYTDESLDFLCKIVMKEQITTLAEQLAKFICDESDSEMSMNNDLNLRYHVILAHNVLHVSEIQPEGHRIASFRQDFFTTDEEFIVLFKNTLCLEFLKKRKSEDTNVQSLLLKFLSEPSEVTTLSKLIGSVLIYKNSKLEFVDKSMTDDRKRQLDKANVSQSIVYEAAELAAKEYLLSLKLKVPASFGNKDLTIRNEKRLNHLTSKIIEILEKSKPNNIVTIDESLEDGFLQLNGGIASAVGNILVYDESSKLLKFTDNCDSLGNLARRWYESLKSKIENLHEYKFDVKVKKFPKLSFERGEYDVSLVRDFYDKLLFYTNQADQNGVEKILREEIEDHPCIDVNNFRVRSDVIFLKYHDEIQKLWMTPKEGPYLTKKSKIYENAVTEAMRESLMGVLNIMHNIKNKDYTFNEDALKPFVMHGQIIGAVIATGNCELTVAKVEQYLGNKDRVVLNLEFVFKLPLKNHNTLCKELTNTTKEKILIIVCHNFKDSIQSGQRLENIVKAIYGKQIIIITNYISVDIMTKYFSQGSNVKKKEKKKERISFVHVLNDERIVFTDLSAESQKKFLAASKIKIQGVDVSLDTIIGDDESVELIDEDVFNKLINNETIEIGNMDIYEHNFYFRKPQFCVDRRISHRLIYNHPYDGMFDHVCYTSPDVVNKVLKTFYDLEDDVVIITAKEGMGKSTLLTHLSLKTKELDPKVWIVRIDLKLFEWELKQYWDTLESLRLMCHAALGKKFDELPSYFEEHYRLRAGKVSIEFEKSPNGTVFLKKCSGSKSTVFQLKMFLHYYNRGNLIFLFDGFDERQALLVKSIRSYPRKQKIWITCSSMDIIEKEFEKELSSSYYSIFNRIALYELKHFSPLDYKTYLNTIWKFKMEFEKPYTKHKSYTKDIIEEIVDFVFIHRDDDLLIFVLLLKLFLKFLKMESACGIDFPYDEYIHNICRRWYTFYSNGQKLRFPDDLTPDRLDDMEFAFDCTIHDIKLKHLFGDDCYALDLQRKKNNSNDNKREIFP